MLLSHPLYAGDFFYIFSIYQFLLIGFDFHQFIDIAF